MLNILSQQEREAKSQRHSTSKGSGNEQVCACSCWYRQRPVCRTLVSWRTNYLPAAVLEEGESCQHRPFTDGASSCAMCGLTKQADRQKHLGPRPSAEVSTQSMRRPCPALEEWPATQYTRANSKACFTG